MLEAVCPLELCCVNYAVVVGSFWMTGHISVEIKKIYKLKKFILTWHSAYEGFTAYIYRIHLLVLFYYYISQGCIS